MKYTTQPKWTELAIGTAITIPASALNNHTGTWRSSRPEPHQERCIQCGVCVLFCPEGCIVMGKDNYPHVNMDYCKGCGICAKECWTSCIAMVEEN